MWQGDFFNEGTYYENKRAVEGDYFRYETLEHPSRSYGQVVNNLIAEQGRKVIRTNWDLPFKVKGYVVDGSGNRWTISRVLKEKGEIAGQASLWLVDNPNELTTLSLIEVENERELE